jgi:hypothetical protein
MKYLLLSYLLFVMLLMGGLSSTCRVKNRELIDPKLQVKHILIVQQTLASHILPTGSVGLRQLGESTWAALAKLVLSCEPGEYFPNRSPGHYCGEISYLLRARISGSICSSHS